MKKTILLWSILLFLGLMAVAQSGAKRGPSTPAERERFISIVHKLEQSPLDKGLRKDREWALFWLTEVPDVNVNICLAPLGLREGEKYKYEPEVFGQYTFSMGVFVIEHPEKADDQTAQYLAGVQGALNAYNSILKSEPKAKSKSLDDLLGKQKQGQLAAFVRDVSKTGCK
jgi:carboxypeptidase Q